VNESANNTGENVFTNLSKSHTSTKQKTKKMHISVPKRTQLRKRLKTNDDNFYDFVKSLLEIDPNLR
jgi:NAD+--asparagine ADP-ribosyltransferase